MCIFILFLRVASLLLCVIVVLIVQSRFPVILMETPTIISAEEEGKTEVEIVMEEGEGEGEGGEGEGEGEEKEEEEMLEEDEQ
jgi:hypothetical protein